MRKVIISAVGIVIVIASVQTCKMMSASKEQFKSISVDKITTVFTEKVVLSEVPVFIESSGVLEALEKLELYSEVQGMMLPDGGKFKEGVSFSAGQTLIAVKANDIQAQLVAQRSSFQRLLTSVMADMRLDYNDQFSGWNTYLTNMNVEKALAELAVVSSEQLNFFLLVEVFTVNITTSKMLKLTLLNSALQHPIMGF